MGLKSEKGFFSSYGRFMHTLIEKYIKGENTPGQLVDIYMRDFAKEVVGPVPSLNVLTNYFSDGLKYLKKLRPFPYKTIATEKEINFKVNGIPVFGVIDFLGEKDGELYLIDHKSRKLKPRSNRAKPTKTDEELDEYLRQLYLYAAAVEQEYGRLPKALCFNCFRVPAFITNPFMTKEYDASKQWLSDAVSKIGSETEFRPDADYFKCTYLCEMKGDCDYYRLR